MLLSLRFNPHGNYAVANMPGAAARTSTIALTNAPIKYAIQIANKGFRQAILDDAGLAKGVNVIDGQVTYRAVADALRLPYHSLEEVMDSRK